VLSLHRRLKICTVVQASKRQCLDRGFGMTPGQSTPASSCYNGLGQAASELEDLYWVGHSLLTALIKHFPFQADRP